MISRVRSQWGRYNLPRYIYHKPQILRNHLQGPRPKVRDFYEAQRRCRTSGASVHWSSLEGTKSDDMTSGRFPKSWGYSRYSTAKNLSHGWAFEKLKKLWWRLGIEKRPKKPFQSHWSSSVWSQGFWFGPEVPLSFFKPHLNSAGELGAWQAADGNSCEFLRWYWASCHSRSIIII